MKQRRGGPVDIEAAAGVALNDGRTSQPRILWDGVYLFMSG